MVYKDSCKDVAEGMLHIFTDTDTKLTRESLFHFIEAWQINVKAYSSTGSFNLIRAFTEFQKALGEHAELMWDHNIVYYGTDFFGGHPEVRLAFHHPTNKAIYPDSCFILEDDIIFGDEDTIEKLYKFLYE
jgi:hypothetical protein